MMRLRILYTGLL